MEEYVGENSVRDFTDTIFSKDGIYTRFTYQDGEQAEELFSTLLGKDLEGRRSYIQESIDWEEDVFE